MALKTPFNAGISAQRTLGGAGTGKTSAAIKSALALLEDGCPASRIALFGPTPQAAAELSARFKAEACRSSADITGVFVGTPRQHALRVLDSDRAFAVTGRRARLLSSLEMDFLIEDLKVSGIRAGRIRSMLQFFYRSWTELADDDEHWLITAEEKNLHTLLKDNLRMLESLLEPEVANLACKVLTLSNEGRLATEGPASECADASGGSSPMTYDHVFVDDYQLLSRASQRLCCLSATSSISVTADPHASVRAYESYPYAAGVEEFEALFSDVKTQVLSLSCRAQAIHRAHVALVKHEQLGSLPSDTSDSAPEGSVKAVVAKTPEEECRSVVKLVRDALGSQEGGRGVLVAVPNANWARNITEALHAAGVEANSHVSKHHWRARLRGGPSDALPRLLCSLRLVADPQDCLAWRVWCGFGDGMANSTAFDGIREAMQGGVTLVEALDSLAAGNLPLKRGSLGADRVAHAYRKGRALIEGAQGRCGAELIDYLSGYLPDDSRARAVSVFSALLNSESGTLSAPAMLQAAFDSFDGPLARGEGVVAVLTYEEAIGAKAGTLIVAGFVNGFVPKGDWFDLTKTPAGKQAKLRLDYARSVAALVDSAQKNLVLSSFSGTDLETAVKLNLKIDRIKMEDGRRTACISPSFFAESLLDLPGSSAFSLHRCAEFQGDAV